MQSSGATSPFHYMDGVHPFNYPSVQPTAIEQEQSGARVLIDLEIRLNLVGHIASDERDRRAVPGLGTLGLQDQRVVRDPYAQQLIDTGVVEAPLNTELVG